MKTFTLFFIFLMTIIQTSGQEVSAEDQIKTLTAERDSVSGQLVIYKGVYNALKEKVFKYDFNPDKTSFLIDSLRASRDSAFSLQARISTMAADSLILMARKNKELMVRIDSIKTAWKKEIDDLKAENVLSEKTFSDLKHLKEMLDQKVITDTEYLVLKKKYIETLRQNK